MTNNCEQVSNIWKKCSICKKPIEFNSDYYLCNISTCRNERTGMRFCSTSCWDAHLGYVTHRSETYAIETKAPAVVPLAQEVETPQRTPIRKIVNTSNVTTTELQASSEKPVAFQADAMKTDCLVVVSKVKKLVSEKSNFNTSQCCIDRLTKKVIEECLKGIKKAELAGRKTVMGRDIE